MADKIERNVERLVTARSRKTGQLRRLIGRKKITVSHDAIRFFADAVRCLEGEMTEEYSTESISTTRHEPPDIVEQVAPQNYPFMMTAWEVAPALVTDSIVVLKPNDATPVNTLLPARLAIPLFPREAFNAALGRAGTDSLVVSDPKASLVSITSSVRTGLQIVASMAVNLTRVYLELGGETPAIVFADVDMDKAIVTITMTGSFDTGQGCTAAARTLVEQSIYAEFLEKLIQKTKRIKFGPSEDQSALYDISSSRNQLEQVKDFIKRLSARMRIEAGGHVGPSSSFCLEPTIISGVHRNDKAIQHEVFGPVMTIRSLTTDEEVLHKTSDVEYGLAASVWTGNHGRTQCFSIDLDFDIMWINNHIPLCAKMPYDGFRKLGYGGSSSSCSLEGYTWVKHVVCDISGQRGLR